MTSYAIRAALAHKEWITECARHETSKFGEWQCDWYSAMAEADQQLDRALSQEKKKPDVMVLQPDLIRLQNDEISTGKMRDIIRDWLNDAYSP